MPTQIDYRNNFSKFIEDFKKDTGLDYKKSPEAYIAYYNARINDMNYQLNHQLGEAILSKIASISG